MFLHWYITKYIIFKVANQSPNLQNLLDIKTHFKLYLIKLCLSEDFQIHAFIQDMTEIIPLYKSFS